MIHPFYQQNKMNFLKRIILLITILFAVPIFLMARKDASLQNRVIDTSYVANLLYPKLVNNFYELRETNCFGFCRGQILTVLKTIIKGKIDSSTNSGLRKKNIINRNK